MIQWLYLIVGILPILYLFLTWNYNYWRKKGIPQVEPLPGIGNILEVLLLRKSAVHLHVDIYDKFPKSSLTGFYQMQLPALLIKHPDLVKTVLVKDFSSFHDNYGFSNKSHDPYLYRDPFISQGPDWKIHRSSLIPALNQGKIKSIFPQMKEITKQLEDFLEKNISEDLEAKNLAFLFTVDMVSNCAFGINGNSFLGTEEVFTKMGQIMASQFKNPVKIMTINNFPTVARLLKWKVIPDSVGDFLKSIITQTDDYRKTNNLDRNDFLQYVLNLRGKKQNQDDKGTMYSMVDVVGYAMTFFVEGFETAAITASFALYELAKNVEIQETLRAEILSTTSNVQDLEFDQFLSIKYLDKVISETLRKYPVMFSMTRECTQNTTINFEGKSFEIEKGTPVVIPVYKIQNDAKYFPNPEVFDPERFSEENISSRQQYTYFPFGEGPRICIGMRFGLAQVKLFLLTILLKYNVLCTSKTPKCINFDKKAFLTTSEDGVWIKFEKRNS